MAILDIRAGSGALAGVNHAVGLLQHARAKQGENITNAFKEFGNTLHKHKMLEEQLKNNDLQRQGMQKDLEYKDEQINILKLNQAKAKKDLEYYDENQALNKKSVLSGVWLNNARASNTHEDTKEKRRFATWLNNNFEPTDTKLNSMIDFMNLKR